MKKLMGVSLLSAMLIIGQPFMALADTAGPKTINFDDLASMITEQNITIRINENERLKTHAGFSDLKSTIRDLENDLDDVNDERDQASSPTQIVQVAAEKRALLDALKQLERTQVDRPTLEAITDLQASMNDDEQVLKAENVFIKYNKLNLALEDISLGIETMQDQLEAKELQKSLGIISQNSVNEFKTKLTDMQTQYESTKFQQDLLVRQLKNLINEQDSDLTIGSIPSVTDSIDIKDQEGDLAKATENSYIIKLQEQQIVILQAALDRAKKDHGMSSKDYKQADFDLTSAKLKLTQLKDSLKADYNTMIDNISKLQSDLVLAKQTLNDKKVALSEAQLKKGLGLISQLELDGATTEYNIQENAVNTGLIDLFNAKCNYEWFLKGMPQS